MKTKKKGATSKAGKGKATKAPKTAVKAKPKTKSKPKPKTPAPRKALNPEKPLVTAVDDLDEEPEVEEGADDESEEPSDVHVSTFDPEGPEAVAGAVEASAKPMLEGRALRHTSGTAEHYTPPAVIEAARTSLGGRIDLDPASCETANAVVGADLFYDIAGNGFERPWSGRVFLNPPGGKCDAHGIPVRKRSKSEGGGFVYFDGTPCTTPTQSAAKAWWFKLCREWRSGRVQAAIFLGYSVEILQTTQVGVPKLDPADKAADAELLPVPLHFPMCFPARRISFLSANADGEIVPFKQNTHASVLVFLPGRKPGQPSPQDFAKAFAAIGKVRL